MGLLKKQNNYLITRKMCSTATNRSVQFFVDTSGANARRSLSMASKAQFVTTEKTEVKLKGHILVIKMFNAIYNKLILITNCQKACSYNNIQAMKSWG